MASSSVTAQSVLGKISEGHLECSICCNRFIQPKLLDCLHTFCLACLQTYRDSQDPNSKTLPCPLCRQETMLGENGVTGLQNNFTLRALVEEVSMQEKLLEGQGSEIKCQACDEKDQAVSICMDCAHFLCQECQRAHQRLAVMKSHKIYTLAQLRSGEIIYKSRLRDDIPKCGVHPEQNLSIFCSTCEQLVCTTCSVLSHGNLKHCLVGLDQALDKCKQDVAKAVSEAEKNKARLAAAMVSIDKSREELDAMFNDTLRKISSKAEEKIAKIREEIDRVRQEEEKLRTEGTRIYKEKLKTCDSAKIANTRGVEQTEHKLEEANRVMAQASRYEILDLKQKLLQNLKEASRLQAETVPDKFSHMAFRAGSKSLGTLVLETKDKGASTAEGSTKSRNLGQKENWELVTEIKSYGSKQVKLGGVFDVAVFSNGELIFADNCYKQLISYMPMTKSKDKSLAVAKRWKIKDLLTPRCVAVNRNDQIVVLDGPTVKTFNRKVQLLHQFTVVGGTDSTPTCLAVDEDSLIAVGCETKKEVSLYNPNGTHIKTLKADMIEEYLTTWKKRLIYSSYKKQMLFCIDFSGVKVFAVSITSANEAWGPTGVYAVAKDGSLYIAMHGQPSGEIHRLHSNGQYIGGIIKDCGFPHNITMTPTGDLVVAAAETVKIYHRL
ncbi:E3 ubiquitin-protein ligase TRIM33-like [Acanthaster planci]|uniref:E3 ubiquitin-protein ligase TRIM33-like n=1 Tax=Acanthaster planci TaxID=133434 RepID=A0A8B7ZVA1_ACAPL|nr:E3 ubiquitin-protein ligase TRIM33-like [Acanthaster planci]